ncbi:RecX family transcriptional regulator [Sphingomonas sp. HITSZ_GF]|uniref:regulatory protein RecX n=1 Tax=Sphingomonas sp. HITSZ_GF TaxID=3037247 RepID=UPI0032203F7F
MPEVEGLADRFAELGYVNDRLYAESKAGAMARRGLGARRVREALRFAGVEEADTAALAPAIEAEARASALAFARRKRIGPFAREAADRALIEKQMAAMIRAGHAPSLARAILRMAPGDDPEATLFDD